MRKRKIAIKFGNVPGLRLLFIAGLAVGLMVNLESGLASSQGCLEHGIDGCLSSLDINSDADAELSSQGFGDVIVSSFLLPENRLPVGLAPDGKGNLYLTDIFPGEVHLINDSGAPPNTIFSYSNITPPNTVPTTGSAVGITTDGTHIYLADSNQADVDIYSLEGVYDFSFSVATKVAFLGSIAYNPITGNLYLVDGGDFSENHIFEYTTAGNWVKTFPLTTKSTDGIAFDPVRCTYWVYDSNSDSVTHYSPTFVPIETFPGVKNAGFVNGEGVAVIGDVLYIAAIDVVVFGTYPSLQGEIVAFDLTGADTSYVDTCNASAATIDLTAQKSNDINGLGQVGTPFNWTIHLANTGSTGATFNPDEVLLRDVLPGGSIYGSPTLDKVSNISGSEFISCNIENYVLTCVASGGKVIIGSNEDFDVIVNVTPTELGTLKNPAEGGICQVDPNYIKAEEDESNNSCTDSVIIEEEPTAIDLVSFEVEANDDQAIITWKTATEIDNAGFNIYRATAPDGPWVQINSVLIAAEGDPVSGADYTFVDTPGRGTFYYRLEDIDFFGISTLHAPALVEMGAVIRLPWFRPSLPKFE